MKTIIFEHLYRNAKLYLKYVAAALLSAVIGYFIYKLYGDSPKMEVFENFTVAIQKFIATKPQYKPSSVFFESFRETCIKVFAVWLSSFVGIGHIISAFFIIKETAGAGFCLSIYTANISNYYLSDVIILFALPALLKLILYCFSGVCSYRFKTLGGKPGSKNIDLVFVFTLYFAVPLIIGIFLAFYESNLIPQYLFNSANEKLF